MRQYARGLYHHLKKGNFETVVSCRESLSKALEELRSHGYEPISFADRAQIEEENEVYDGISNICQGSNMGKEGVIFTPGKEVRVVRSSPYLSSPVEASKEWQPRPKEEFYPTEAQIKRALIHSIEAPKRIIPIEEFELDKFTIWLFGGVECAKKYADFCKVVRTTGLKFNGLRRDYIDNETHNGRSFARHLEFYRVNHREGNKNTLEFDPVILTKGPEGHYWMRGIKLK